MALGTCFWRLSLVVAALLGATGCDAGCENRVLREVVAPDRELKAVVFGRSCGATTGFTTQVSVLPVARALSGVGNVFVADGDHGRAAPGPGGGPAVDVRWLDRRTLEIRYDARARVFKQDSVHEATDIRFVVDSVP